MLEPGAPISREVAVRPHVQLVTDDAVTVVLEQPLRVELEPSGTPAFYRGDEPVQPRYADLVGLVEALTRELIGDVFTSLEEPVFTSLEEPE